jgi:hypothetical protein
MGAASRNPSAASHLGDRAIGAVQFFAPPLAHQIPLARDLQLREDGRASGEMPWTMFASAAQA